MEMDGRCIMEMEKTREKRNILLEYDGEFVCGVSRNGVDACSSFNDAMCFTSYDTAMAFAMLCAEYSHEMKEHPEKLHAYELIGL